jgi:acyl-coenzyme A synthetase/AMP-(fatty) acid ligase
MVKRRGYRIELGEVEAALAHHETIIEAGALAVEVPDKGLQIIAVCSTRPETAPPNSMTLMAFCQNYIPQYMLPDRFIFVDALPQTSTHKVDYQRLKELIHD